ncbi:reverse transcriptase domain-containing protein [Streptomyces scopuliridis]|uniref:Uncharacterized protein n=1 Tax=Streptomyces scopuliridis TaxID=452529 RepID=A0ACD4ZCT4_9ACTN|nr:reverse transcriptase domain-containing protein [Streptomyces scopuliridis]WSB95601.1 hypothetical protein OG835_00095 [Streptomyces scopuliridis]
MDRFEVGWRDDEGEHRRPLTDVLSVEFEAGLPVRGFPSYRGQRHFPGLYWSATTGGHVGFESWLERDRGRRRRTHRAYEIVENRIARARRHGDREAVRALRRERRSLPSQDPHDPGYRRLRYVRYCDDFLLGFAGPKSEAVEIKEKIRTFLRDELKLELSESKTLITHATSQAARFLGYEIRAQHADTKITRNRRAVNGAIGLFVPRDVIRDRCARYMSGGKPALRGPLLHDEDFTIVAKYGSE